MELSYYRRYVDNTYYLFNIDMFIDHIWTHLF